MSARHGGVGGIRIRLALFALAWATALVTPTGAASQQRCSDPSQPVEMLVIVPSQELVAPDRLADQLPIAESRGLNPGERPTRTGSNGYWTVLAARAAPPPADMQVQLAAGAELCKDGSCVTDVSATPVVPEIAMDRWVDRESRPCVAVLSVVVDTATYITVTKEKAKGRLRTDVSWSDEWTIVQDVSDDRTLTLPLVERSAPLREPIPASAKDSVAIVIEIERSGSGRDTLKFLSQPLHAFPGKTPLEARDVLDQVCHNQNKLCQCVKPSRFLRFSCFTQAQRLDFKQLVIETGNRP